MNWNSHNKILYDNHIDFLIKRINDPEYTTESLDQLRNSLYEYDNSITYIGKSTINEALIKNN